VYGLKKLCQKAEGYIRLQNTINYREGNLKLYLCYANTISKIKFRRINLILWDFSSILHMHGSYLQTKRGL